MEFLGYHESHEERCRPRGVRCMYLLLFSGTALIEKEMDGKKFLEKTKPAKQKGDCAVLYIQ